MNQRSIFLFDEGDNWYIRNRKPGYIHFSEAKFLLKYPKLQTIEKFLEVGCSSGRKTKFLARKLHAEGTV